MIEFDFDNFNINNTMPVISIDKNTIRGGLDPCSYKLKHKIGDCNYFNKMNAYISHISAKFEVPNGTIIYLETNFLYNQANIISTDIHQVFRANNSGVNNLCEVNFTPDYTRINNNQPEWHFRFITYDNMKQLVPISPEDYLIKVQVSS